jgi:uncharacterized protein HemY
LSPEGFSGKLVTAAIDRVDVRTPESRIAAGRAAPSMSIADRNLAEVQLDQGKIEEAEKTAEAMSANLPASPATSVVQEDIAFARRNWDRMVAIAESLLKARPADGATQIAQTARLATVGFLHGELRNGQHYRTTLRQRLLQRGNRQAALNLALDEPELDAWFRGEKAGAFRGIERALAEHPLDSLPPVSRPYVRLVRLFAAVDRPDLAKAMMQAAARVPSAQDPADGEATRHYMAGTVALAERR